MEGDTLVNGEPQKRADEILAEVSVTLTLSRLNGSDAAPGANQAAGCRRCTSGRGASLPALRWTGTLHSQTGSVISPAPCIPPRHATLQPCPHLPVRCSAGEQPANVTSGFVETFGVGVCRGVYAESLRREWHRWDEEHGSENEEVDIFGADQLYVVRCIEGLHPVGWAVRCGESADCAASGGSSGDARVVAWQVDRQVPCRETAVGVFQQRSALCRTAPACAPAASLRLHCQPAPAASLHPSPCRCLWWPTVVPIWSTLSCDRFRKCGPSCCRCGRSCLPGPQHLSLTGLDCSSRLPNASVCSSAS